MRARIAAPTSVAALAAWLDFSRLQELHHADSLVPVLAGLTAWTPFYWGQDRYGMLIPLLALPVRDPALHLLLQGFLTMALSLWGLILLVEILLPRSVPWTAAAALLVILLLLIPPAEEVRFNILWVQPYMLSFGLALTAVKLVNRGGTSQLATAALLYLAAAWVNVSLAMVVAPLVVWRALVTDYGRFGLARLRFAVSNLLFLAIATYASVRLSHAVSLPHTPTELVPAAAWPFTARALFRAASGYEKVRAWVGIALGLAALGLLGLAAESVRRIARPILSAAGGLVLTAIVPFVLAASSRWVAQNDYSVRYLIPTLVLLQAACCLLATLPMLALHADQQHALNRASVVAVAVALLVAVGPPSRKAVEHAFESRWGTTAREVIAARATHVTGDYWKVWPTVFYASWLLGTAGRHDWPDGVTDRSIATLSRSRAVSHPRVAAIGSVTTWLALLGPHRWYIAERRPTCVILTVQ
ncbi:MAG: hypothetical protein ACLQIH_15400 [Myxococcaceae bacterium]